MVEGSLPDTAVRPVSGLLHHSLALQDGLSDPIAVLARFSSNCTFFYLYL